MVQEVSTVNRDPRFSNDKLRRYDAIWSRVFSGQRQEGMPKVREASAAQPQDRLKLLPTLMAEELECAQVYQAMAGAARRQSAALRDLSRAKERCVKNLSDALYLLTGERVRPQERPRERLPLEERLRRQILAEHRRHEQYLSLLRMEPDHRLQAQYQEGALLALRAETALTKLFQERRR